MRLERIVPERVHSALRNRSLPLPHRSGGPDRSIGGDGAGSVALTGIVETFTAQRVDGWIAVPVDAGPVRISLHADELEVAATWATDAPAPVNNSAVSLHAFGAIRPFALRLKDVWNYLPAGARLTVRAQGEALPISGRGMFFLAEQDGPHSLKDLERKFAKGFVFSHSGRLQLSKKHDTVWQSRVMGLYSEVRAAVQQDFGYDPFLVYGTLLGAVREGGYIGHDMDFDCAYLSTHTDPAKATKELEQIAIALVERGFDVETMWTALHIHHSDHPATRIDLFHLYFDESGEICFPFGIAGTTRFTQDDWAGLRDIDFSGSRAAVPVAAEALVEHIYGAGWREPKPGFDWTRDRTKRAAAGRMPLALRENAYWSNFYAHHSYSDGSTFFAAVNSRPDTPRHVIDIGCGQGRDSQAFAAAGRRVLGLDRSEIGVRSARDAAAERGLSDRLRFAACDVSDAVAVKTALVEATDVAGDEPVLFYLRFFLHSIPEAAQETLMSAIAEHARPGDYFAAEFRTEKDEHNVKVHGKHYRRFQNGPAFGARLGNDYGFTVLDEQEGTGLSPYGDEDPELYRVVARRS